MKNDNQPRPPVSALPTYDEALARVLSFVPQLPSESVPLLEANGRVLREALKADRDQPPFNRSAMDGFALRSNEFNAKNVYGVTGGVAAGQRGWESLSDRAGVIRIATGAPIPDTFDAVIPIEMCEVREDHGTESVVFNVDQVAPWQNIHPLGKDASAGQTVLEAGTRMGPAQIGIAAAVGAARVEVTVQPRITLLTSGDEVKPFATETQALESQQIRNSNGPMLTALFEAIGTPLLQHVHVPDESEQTLAAAREALSQSHLVVTVGGVSAGQRDLLPWAWKKLGLDVILHGVAIQPGKPIFVAGPQSKSAPEKEASGSTLNEGEGGGTGQDRLVIGLPGNPVSVLATAHLFVWPVLLRMLGTSRGLPWREITLVESMRTKAARQLFRSVRVNEQGNAESLAWQGSGDLMHTGQADGWVRLPLRDGDAEAGERVAFLPLIK